MNKPRKPFKRQGPAAPSAGPRKGRPFAGPPSGPRGPRPGNRPFGPPQPAVDPARDRALRAVASQVRRFPDLQIDALDTQELSDLDAAFAHALYGAVISRWLTLRFILESRLNRPDLRPAPAAAAALLVGAAQILLLDRVPIHSAVDTSVEWVKNAGTPGAGRMVNAVLRAVADLIPEGGKQRRDTITDAADELPMPDGSALVLAKPVLPTDPVQRLSVATSCPADLIRAWSRDRGMREARRLALHSLIAPPVILNTAFAAAPLPPECAPHDSPGHHVYTGTHEQLAQLLQSRRDIWAQDPASSLAVATAGDLKPSLVVDACAGLGTKTRQLAAMFPDADILAADVDLVRVQTLRSATAGTRVTVVPYQKLIDYAGKADLVLLDVPCSNTGVLARRVEARYRFDRENTEKLASTQRQIIADSIRLLRPGGRILYSTCSLDASENRAQADWASRWHGLRLAREHDRAPQGLPGDPPARYTDGSYAALLE
ncbi:MAG: transcription antitermination factor NusB [Planctomycetota bacterium]|nr:transcription antitermination factor NusB [Planctomycetota bacterium]